MSTSTSPLNYAQLIGQLTDASTVPEIDEEDESNDPAKTYLEKLEQIVGVLRSAEGSKSAGGISEEEWRMFLNTTDETISSLCSEVYESNYTDTIGVFGAPTSSGQYIKSKKAAPLGSGAGMLNGLEAMLNMFAADVQARTGKTIKEIMLDKGVAPQPWSATARPSPHTTRLSRFTKEYNEEAVQSTLSSVPAGTRRAILPIIQASALLRTHNIANPWGMAVGGDVLVVAGAGGWKERESRASRFSIPATSDDAEQILKQSNLKTGFAGPFGNLLVDSYAIWGSGDERIKAFDLTTGKLKHTLSCRDGYDQGMFGIHDKKIFRANASGTFACWNRATLETHLPSISKASTKPAFGGLIDDDHLGWLDGDDDVEMSRGQAPDSTFTVPSLKGPLGNLVNVPNTSRFLGTKALSGGGMEPEDLLGVRIFDIARPEAGATVVGLGLGANIESIKTHEEMPDNFVAAGSDPITRIFDLRNGPLPQIVLEGHSRDVTSCAIASFGHGQFPIIFTGGKDEAVRAWDIRRTKTCLYELSAGTLTVQDLAWHDATRTLFISGQNLNEDRMGNHHDYDELDEEDEEDSATYWPRTAVTGKDYFGKRWCSTTHAILEYKFKSGADASDTPAFDEPHMGGMW
ncbi:hypothetical protein FRB93_008277 [Tulasnella sp. JGI-2019a]|nr:hypothetical protein FRB93_008277 [Tulasnella sp. JGI-2019a]